MSLLGRMAGASLLVLASVVQPLSAARAEIVISQLIVDLQPPKSNREDVEVWNNSPERAYIAVEPAEVVNAGLPTETRRTDVDPQRLGLLVSPARMILEGGERKLLRLADLLPPADRERVYRVTVKPVVGQLSSEQSGLKILVGYDMLVLVRPAVSNADLTATRTGNSLYFHNVGNVSVELVEGRQCGADGKACNDLPGKRLYPGAEWTEQVKASGSVEYTIKSPGKSVRKTL